MKINKIVYLSMGVQNHSIGHRQISVAIFGEKAWRDALNIVLCKRLNDGF